MRARLGTCSKCPWHWGQTFGYWRVHLRPLTPFQSPHLHAFVCTTEGRVCKWGCAVRGRACSTHSTRLSAHMQAQVREFGQPPPPPPPTQAHREPLTRHLLQRLQRHTDRKWASTSSSPPCWSASCRNGGMGGNTSGPVPQSEHNGGVQGPGSLTPHKSQSDGMWSRIKSSWPGKMTAKAPFIWAKAERGP